MSEAEQKDFFSGLSENLASALTYSLGFVSGIIFLLVDKRQRVKENAAQSIVVFGVSFVALFVLGMIPVLGWFSPLISLALLALWLFLMIKSYQGQDYKIKQIEGLVDSVLKNIK